MKRWLPILLLSLCLSAWATPGVTVRTELVTPQNPLPFGKSAELLIHLTWPEDQSFQPPEAGTLELAGARVQDRFSVDRGGDGINHSLDYHIVFTRLEPGKFEVPAVQISPGVESEPQILEFAGAVKKESDKPGEIRGPKGTVELSTRDFWKRASLWLAGILAGAGLIVLLVHSFGLLDRFRSPKVRALKGLGRLSKQNPAPEAMLLRCVEILRTYLHEAYGLTTRQATSREILRQMTLDNRCIALKPAVEELLETGDGVKFAARTLSEPQARDHFQNLLSTLKREQKMAK